MAWKNPSTNAPDFDSGWVNVTVAGATLSSAAVWATGAIVTNLTDVEQFLTVHDGAGGYLAKHMPVEPNETTFIPRQGPVPFLPMLAMYASCPVEGALQIKAWGMLQ